MLLACYSFRHLSLTLSLSQTQRSQADYVRYVPWFPYPVLGVAELSPPDPQTKTTSWDFSLCGRMMDDVMKATRGHSTIINWSTQAR